MERKSINDLTTVLLVKTIVSLEQNNIFWKYFAASTLLLDRFSAHCNVECREDSNMICLNNKDEGELLLKTALIQSSRKFGNIASKIGVKATIDAEAMNELTNQKRQRLTKLIAGCSPIKFLDLRIISKGYPRGLTKEVKGLAKLHCDNIKYFKVESVAKDFKAGAMNDVCEMVRSLNRLRYLHLSDWKHPLGTFSDMGMAERLKIIGETFDNIETLKLDYCFYLTNKVILNLAGKMNNLKVLHLSHSRNMTDMSLNAIVNFRNIQELQLDLSPLMTCSGIMKMITNLECLAKFTLLMSYCSLEHLKITSIKDHCSDLEISVRFRQ